MILNNFHIYTCFQKYGAGEIFIMFLKDIYWLHLKTVKSGIM